MKRTLTVGVVSLCVVLAGWACSRRGSTATNPQTNSNQSSALASGELKFKAPDGWTVEKPTSSMRVAQYKLPKVEGDKDDATLVLDYFGATQGGTAQANIERWIGQIQQPDGSDSKSKAKTESMTVNGLNVSNVDVAGVYTAAMAPGSKNFHNDADYR